MDSNHGLVEVVVDEDKWNNVRVDSQVLGMFMACPQKYQYSFERQLVPMGGMSHSIVRGSIIHDALLAYWKERIKTGNYEMATSLAIRSAKEKLEASGEFDREERINVLNNFLEFLKFIQGASWIPLAAEYYFRVKAFEDEKLKLRIFLSGSIDLVSQLPSQTGVFPIDFKTESTRWFYSEMSTQFKIYAIACQSNMIGVQRVGFQDNVEVKDKFKMETLAFDPDVLDEFKNVTLPHWVKQLLVAKEEGYFPMNTSNCISGHFKCIYSDGNAHKGICNVSRAIREQKIQRYFVKGEKWEPAKLSE